MPELLGMNKDTVQRIIQFKGWQVRKRAVGHRPRIQELPSVTTAPDQRPAADNTFGGLVQSIGCMWLIGKRSKDRGASAATQRFDFHAEESL